MSADKNPFDGTCFSCHWAQPTGRKMEMTCHNEQAIRWHGLPSRPCGAMVWNGEPVHKLFGCNKWEARAEGLK